MVIVSLHNQAVGNIGQLVVIKHIAPVHRRGKNGNKGSGNFAVESGGEFIHESGQVVPLTGGHAFKIDGDAIGVGIFYLIEQVGDGTGPIGGTAE